MNRRSFIKGLAGIAAGLWLPSTRTIIDLNPQARPVLETRLIQRWVEGKWVYSGPNIFVPFLNAQTESELEDMKIAWFDTRTRGEVKDTTIIDNDGPGVYAVVVRADGAKVFKENSSGWTSQRSVTLRYHQDLWPVPHVEVVIDNTTVASFIGSNAHDQAMAFYNDPSRLKLHAPEHAPLRMPDERVKGFL